MTMIVHPSERVLGRFVAGDLPVAGSREVVRHLLGGCPDCRRTAGRLWLGGGAEGPAVEPALEVEIDRLRALRRVVLEERSRAEPLLAELEAQPQGRRTMLAVNSGRFHNWHLAEMLSSRSEDLGFEDPGRALEYASLSVTLAERLSERRHGRALVNDMRARAWGGLGNARRIAADLAGAREAFEKAVELLEEGSGDPLELARLLRWRALAAQARGELVLSARLFDRAIGIHRRLGDLEEMGRLMAHKGIALSAPDFERAFRTEQAARLEERPASAR